MANRMANPPISVVGIVIAVDTSIAIPKYLRGGEEVTYLIYIACLAIPHASLIITGAMVYL